MSGVDIENTVIARDHFGRFISKLEVAKSGALDEIKDEGVRTARALAPHGPGRSDYGRRPKLLTNIKGRVVGTRAIWGVSAPNARAQEEGAGPHIITGNPNLKFYWERRGRWMNTPAVNHPGNPPQPFLAPSFAIMRGKAMEILKRYY